MITTSCHCVLIDACAAPCTSRQSKSMHMCLMRRSTESSSARGGLVSCTRNKNITCFPSANAHVGPSRSSITLAFEARLARDAWSHQFMELRAVPAVCLTRADEISSQHAARPPLRLATGSSSLRGSITPKFGPLRPRSAKISAYTKVYESVCPVGVGVHCGTMGPGLRQPRRWNPGLEPKLLGHLT